MPGQLERFQRWLREGTYRPLPILRHLGATLREVDAGRAVFELVTAEEHMGPVAVHGGVLATIADAAMATALVTTLEVGESMTTVELKMNYLRPVPQGETLTATATLIKAGRTLSLVECRITDRAGRLVAHGTSTCMTLR